MLTPDSKTWTYWSQRLTGQEVKELESSTLRNYQENSFVRKSAEYAADLRIARENEQQKDSARQSS